MEKIDKKLNVWPMFIILYITAITVSLNQFKVSPVMAILSSELGISLTNVSFLVSIFALTGIFISLPAAYILKKIGTKRLGILILFCLIVGNIIGITTSSFPVFLISRVIEGFGFSLVILLGIVLINQWFDEKKAGMMTGIYTTFPGVAAAIMLGQGAKWAEMYGWRGVWYGCAILAVILLILWTLFIKDKANPEEKNIENKRRSIIEGLKNPQAILLGICLGAAVFVMFSFLNLYFTIFTEYYLVSIEKASFYSSIAGSSGVFFGIIAGILVSKIRKPGIVIFVAFVGITIVSLTAFMLNSPVAYIVHVLAMSFFTTLCIPATMSIGPLTAKKPEYIGLAVAIVNEIYFIGNFLGTPVVTWVVERTGDWASASGPMLISCVIGFVAVIIYMIVDK